MLIPNRKILQILMMPKFRRGLIDVLILAVFLENIGLSQFLNYSDLRSPRSGNEKSMHKKCPNCRLTNFINADSCVRCHYLLPEAVPTSSIDSARGGSPAAISRRIFVCFVICLLIFPVFYATLTFSSRALNEEESQSINRAINLLEKSGFIEEAHYLRNLADFRGSDNWLNSIVAKESAYAATNYPFAIITVYPDFFVYAEDDTERAAILLHEAKHLQGADEKDAYEFVWENRRFFGWTKDKYSESVLWRNVRGQTKEYAPHLFICNFNELGDCTSR